MNDFETRLQSDIELVNQALDRHLLLPGQPYDRVVEAMRYSVMNAGKRIRPVLALEFCRLNGGNAEDALDCACAVEMIHCYSLIHDDLPCMDDDAMRRGKPACHVSFGEDTALLAGDALLTRAFGVIAGSSLFRDHPRRGLLCVEILSRFSGTAGMVGGQVLDLKAETTPTDEQGIYEIHRLKTGALIAAACQMGAACAGAGESAMQDAVRYGENLGLAFQLIDDILDVTGEEETLGKPIGSDEKQGKTTMLGLCGMEQTVQLAETYTQNAVTALSHFEKNMFLKELTVSLLERRA